MNLYWDAVGKEVTFPLNIAAYGVLCRVPYYVLRRTADEPDAHPLKLASAGFATLLEVAISKAKRSQYELDGTVIVRLMDLPAPPSSRDDDKGLLKEVVRGAGACCG